MGGAGPRPARERKDTVMRIKTWSTAILLSLTLSGCAGLNYQGSSPHYDRYRISAEEIAQNADQVRNLYELVQRLRPHWLDADVAFQNQVQLGSLATLTSLSPDYASSLVYLDSTQAGAQLPGLTGVHIKGAIVVYR